MRALTLALVVATASGCWSGRYLWRQAAGEMHMLRARRPIEEVLADRAASPDLKRRLELATAARAFGIRALGLRGGDGFTTYVDLGDRPLAWNVMAAEKDRLKPHLNRFPIVGAIPYLGFFAEADARAEAARLERLDLDVLVRPVAGYSTLGVTADPIYSSMLEGSDARIVEVVLHEMTHATVYLPGHAEWNESLATLVGVRGAAAYFAARGDDAGVAEVTAEAARHAREQERFARFLEPVARALEDLYAGPYDRAEKLRRREVVFARARADFRAQFPPEPGKKPGVFARVPLNNAVIIAYTTYHRYTPEHLRLLTRMGGDVRALLKLYRRVIEDELHPLDYLSHYGVGAPATR